MAGMPRSVGTQDMSPLSMNKSKPFRKLGASGVLFALVLTALVYHLDAHVVLEVVHQGQCSQHLAA